MRTIMVGYLGDGTKGIRVGNVVKRWRDWDPVTGEHGWRAAERIDGAQAVELSERGIASRLDGEYAEGDANLPTMQRVQELVRKADAEAQRRRVVVSQQTT